MLARLIRACLAQRLFVLLATALIAVGGWYAFLELPIDAFPDVSGTQVKIIMKAPGMTSEEVETRIVTPIEVEMLGIPRTRILRSVTKYGLADITIDFEDGADIYWARQQVGERLAGITDALPASASGGMAPITTPLGEMFMFTVEAPGMTLQERRTLLDRVLRPALRTVPGVADVNALGGAVRAFEVVPNHAALAAAGVSLEQLLDAIRANNRNDGAGRLTEGGEVLLVRSEGSIATLDDLGAVVVAVRDGVPLRLSSLAAVRIGTITRNGAVTQHGQGEAVEGLVLGLAGANAQRVVRGVQQKLAELQPALPKGVAIKARVGSDEIGLDPMGLNQTDTYLLLKPRGQWRMKDKDALIAEVRKVLDQLPGIKYSFTQPIEMRVSEMIIGVRGDIAVKVFGPDLARLDQYAAGVESVLKSIPGNQDVYRIENGGVQYLRVVVDRMAAGRLGMSVEEVQDALRVQIEGQLAGHAIEDGRRTPIVVRAPDSIRLSPAEFAAVRITGRDGASVPLAALARLERAEGPLKIDREMGSRYAVVVANVAGRDLVGFVEEAKAAVGKRVPLASGYRIGWGGQFENQQRAAARLSLVVPASLGLIFVLLFSTFGSVRQALLILSIIPFALVGGVVALWLAGEYLSVPASVGFIALLGITVLNGVVLVTYFNQLRAGGMPLAEVVVQGARRRLRPIMMTASITAFGLIPLLLATGPGSEIQRPLAIVVIGGLVSATALTLILLPILYLRFAFPKQEIQHG